MIQERLHKVREIKHSVELSKVSWTLNTTFYLQDGKTTDSVNKLIGFPIFSHATIRFSNWYTDHWDVETQATCKHAENTYWFVFSPLNLEKLKEGHCREFGGLLQANPFDGEKAGGAGGDDWEEAGGSGVEGREAHLRITAGSHGAREQKKWDGAAFEHRGPPPPLAGQESILTLSS